MLSNQDISRVHSKSTKDSTQSLEYNEKFTPDIHVIEGKRGICARLSGKALPIQLVGLEDQLAELSALMKRTLSNQESNSVLISGPLGSGKTALVNLALAQTQSSDLNFKVVKLCGLVHTDDRHALQSMARQLELKLAVDQEDDEESIEVSKFSFPAALDFILAELGKQSLTNTEPVSPLLVVLDHFDLFAHHAKQALLYNLFDLVQRATTLPLLVIGVTSKLDALNLLEKRVKSRFSHRQIYTFPPKNFSIYMDILKQALKIPEELACGHEQCEAFNRSVDTTLSDPTVICIAQSLFNISLEIKPLFNLVLLTMMIHGNRSGSILPLHISSIAEEQGVQEFRVDGLSLQLKQLSLLELGLLVALKRLIHQGFEEFNFTLLFKQYDDLTAAAIARDGFSRRASSQAAMKALEHLLDLELLQSLEPPSSRTPLTFRRFRTYLSPQAILKAVQSYPNCPSIVLQWAQHN